MTDKELLDKLQDPQSRLEILLYLIYESLGSSGGGGGGGGTGTKDYNALDNKPSINGTTLQGDLTLEDIGAASNGSRNSYDPNSESVVIGGL